MQGKVTYFAVFSIRDNPDVLSHCRHETHGSDHEIIIVTSNEDVGQLFSEKKGW